MISRRSYLLQIYSYLTNILTISGISSTIQTEVHTLQNQILDQFMKSPRGEQFVQYVKSHHLREQMWLEWKEKRMPPMIQSHDQETHHPYVCGTSTRSEQDTRILCCDVSRETPHMSDPDLRYMEYDPTPYDSIQICSGASPPLETYEQSLKEALDSENGVEEELRPYHDPVRIKVWFDN